MGAKAGGNQLHVEARYSEGYVLVKAFRGGGLGDALRAVILALLYADRTDRRVVVDWRDGSFGLEGDEVFGKLFQLERPHGQTSLTHLQEQCSVVPEIWRGQLALSMRSLWLAHGITGWNREFARQTFSFDQQRDHKETVCVMWDFDNLANYKNSEIQQIVRKYLSLAPDLQKECQAFISSKFHQPMLGVHIRAANEPKAASKFSSKKIIRNTVQKLLNTRRFTGIFLSTDHLPTQQWFLRDFPGTVVRNKPFPKDGSPLHLTDFGQARLEQSQDAIIDMWLLSSCQAIVHPGNSSFSLCSSYFSNLTDEALIALSSRRSLGQKIANTLTAILPINS
jgi:hypothetical protein